MDDFLKSMTLEEKAAQLIVVRTLGSFQRIDELVGAGKVAGVGAIALRKGSLEELVGHINALKAACRTPLTLYVDAETGLAQMLPYALRYPPNMAIGATGSAELARQVGRAIGEECRALGFTIIGSPVLDINSNPQNPIVNTRAFGDRAEDVCALGGAFVQGLQSAGMIPCGKHFPGHGDTREDSHVEIPLVDRDRESLRREELSPYYALAKEMWGVMTAHICYPQLSAECAQGLPATFSRTVIHDLLREEIGFEGLIVSDSLSMASVLERYGIEECAVRAVAAGHDVILQDYNSDPMITLDAVVGAVRSGRIPLAQIDDSVARLIRYKKMAGALSRAPVDYERAKQMLESPEHRQLAKTIAERAVTLVRAQGAYPLERGLAGRTLALTTRGSEVDAGIRDFGLAGQRSDQTFREEVQRRCSADVRIVSDDPDAEEIASVLEMARGYDTVLCAPFIRVVSYQKNSGVMTRGMHALLCALRAQQARLALILFGSPYPLAQLPEMDACLVGYGDDESCIRAAVSALFGEIPAPGRLPVTVSGEYPRGLRCAERKREERAV